MNRILSEPIENYLIEKSNSFRNNELASNFRNLYPELIRQALPDSERYKIIGSPGKGRWADCPWIAALDILVTNSPEKGYYPVFLFKPDMSGVYLSLNQGVKNVKDDYKSESRTVLRLRAEDFRSRLEIPKDYLLNIDLGSQNDNARLYEAGNIIAKYYPATNLPTANILINEMHRILSLYSVLAFNDIPSSESQGKTVLERKQYRLHYRIERSASVANKVKAHKGYKCQACSMKFSKKYGKIGNNFIEAHHLIPIKSLEIGTFILDIDRDFAVLCSNCHRMIHRLKDCSNLIELKEILKQNAR